MRAALLFQGQNGTVSHAGVEALGIAGSASSSKVGMTYGFSF